MTLCTLMYHCDWLLSKPHAHFWSQDPYKLKMGDFINQSCENLLFFLDMISKVYKVIFYGFFDNSNIQKNYWNIESCQNWKLPKLKVAKTESDFSISCYKLVILMNWIENCQNWKLPKLKVVKFECYQLKVIYVFLAIN